MNSTLSQNINKSTEVNMQSNESIQINLTQQEILVIVNALHEVSTENRNKYHTGEDYERVAAVLDDAVEQEQIAEKLSENLDDILPIEGSISAPGRFPTVGPFCF